jgi:Uma2 family endonuclease
MEYFHGRNLGEVFNAPIDLILTRHDVFQPDLVVVADPAQISARGIEGVPLLVVEILSPSTRTRDRTVKAQRYAALGIPHYWIADPDDQLLQCFRLDAGRYVSVVEVQGARSLSHPDFAGLSLTLAKLWGK